MKVTQVRVHNWKAVDHFNYIAEAIEDKGKYYYRIDNVTLEITQLEYSRAIGNPYLYYFSTALKLHNLIQHKKKNPDYIRDFN
jgi:hypothetical protein